MTNFEERLKIYKEKLNKNYDLVIDLEKNKLPAFKKASRIICDPKDDKELRIAEAYLNSNIATKNIKWAVDNGVYEPKSVYENETLKIIVDYSINSTKSLFERRSLNSYIEESFGTINPEISAKIMYQVCTIPKEEKIQRYVNNKIKTQDIKSPKYQKIKFMIAFTYSIIKLISLAPRVFKIIDTEQDINDYEIYSRTFVNLCEEGIKDNIKDYWNNVLSKLDYEDTKRIYNSISEEDKEKLAKLDPEDIKSVAIFNAIMSLSAYSYKNSVFDLPLKDINIIAEKISVSKEELAKLVSLGIFARKPIVETWFELDRFENSFDQPSYKYPFYIASYLKEAMRESKANKEEKEKPKEYKK